MKTDLTIPMLNVLRVACDDGAVVVRPHNASSVYALARRGLLSTPAWDHCERALAAQPLAGALTVLKFDTRIDLRIRRAGARRLALREAAWVREAVANGDEAEAVNHAVAMAHAGHLALELSAGL